MAPLSVIARSFHARVSMPAASAAASFCLIAISAMPKRERSISRETNMMTMSMPSARSV